MGIRRSNLKPGVWGLLALAFALVPSALSVRAQQTPAATPNLATQDVTTGVAMLGPTRHPPVPRDLSQVWLAPIKGPSYRPVVNANLQAATGMIDRREYSKALGVLTQSSMRQGILADYATYYAGISHLELLRFDNAERTFKALRERKPFGYLSEAAALGQARAFEGQLDFPSAIRVYEDLIKDTKLMRPDEVYMRLGLAARAAHERNKAADAFARVYYEFALSERAADAGAQLTSMDVEPADAGTPRYKLDLGRAERLFGAKQYGPARSAFDSLRVRAADEDKEIIGLRIAESDFFLKRQRNARDELRPFIEHASRQGEALYFYAIASRDLGDQATYLRLSRRVVDEFPSESWGEESLNALASFYLKTDDDQADVTFRELLARYPKSPYSERAAWKVGWRAYREGRLDETVRVFDSAAVDFPRSDYRPGWLYWSARAHERIGSKETAQARYLLVLVDYLNSYYGRLTVKRLDRSAISRIGEITGNGSTGDVPLPAEPPPNAPVIRALLESSMYDDAVNELRFAQRVWADTPAIQATLAWTSQQQSIGKKGTEQFALLRGGITQMRRAYPQFLTAGGENLPHDLLTVIFPLSYWDLIKTHSAANGLDPYLIAALVAQESTFVADIRSPANAYGLMQLLPGTARQYARKINLKYSPALLTRPESNIRLGTAFFADAVRQFGSQALALASYNAGPTPVRRWVAERPGIDPEEFIDDIPYPETQNYVKRILGTADDYRRLYDQTAARTR